MRCAKSGQETRTRSGVSYCVTRAKRAVTSPTWLEHLQVVSSGHWKCIQPDRWFVHILRFDAVINISRSHSDRTGVMNSSSSKSSCDKPSRGRVLWWNTEIDPSTKWLPIPLLTFADGDPISRSHSSSPRFIWIISLPLPLSLRFSRSSRGSTPIWGWWARLRLSGCNQSWLVTAAAFREEHIKILLLGCQSGARWGGVITPPKHPTPTTEVCSRRPKPHRWHVKTSGNDQMFFTDQIIWSFSLFYWFVSFYKQESLHELSPPKMEKSLKHPANILASYALKSLPFKFKTSRQQHLKFPQVTGFIIIFSSSSSSFF